MDLYNSPIYIDDLISTANATVNIEWLRGKSILVTGARGTIGSYIVDVLQQYNKTEKADITIYAAGRTEKGLEERFHKIKTDNLYYVEYDNHKNISFDFPVDYIVHAAGNAYPAKFNDDPVGTIIGNISGTYRLLEYARTHATKKILFVSSGEVYGQACNDVKSFDEMYNGPVDFLSARSCYPESKRAAETLCISYSKQYGLQTVIARPCHTYGPWMNPSDNRANVQFFNRAINRQNIIMKSSGQILRSYCYVADCVSAILTILINGENGEAYNCANTNATVTIAEFAKMIAEMSNCKVLFEEPTDVEITERTPFSMQVLDSKKIESLGWRGKYSIKEGIEHMLEILLQSTK